MNGSEVRLGEDPCLSLMAQVALQAVEDIRTVGRGRRPDVDLSVEMGFLGPTDELRSFLHGRLYGGLLAALDEDQEEACKRLGYPLFPDCPCEGCLGDTGIRPPHLYEVNGTDVYQVAARLVISSRSVGRWR